MVSRPWPNFFEPMVKSVSTRSPSLTCSLQVEARVVDQKPPAGALGEFFGPGIGQEARESSESFGGPGRDRTDDLFHAMEARSQLRHRPT